MIAAGEMAPDFTLLTDAGEPLTLSALRGRPVVLYFYPKADTPGCTTEACEFRDDIKKFTKKGAAVLGVSPDKPAAQARFKQKYDLPFTLLADQGGRVRKAYGVPAALGFLPGRVTYVIDRQGTVRHVFKSMTNIDQHVGDALAVVRRLQAEAELPAGRRSRYSPDH